MHSTKNNYTSSCNPSSVNSSKQLWDGCARHTHPAAHICWSTLTFSPNSNSTPTAASPCSQASAPQLPCTKAQQQLQKGTSRYFRLLSASPAERLAASFFPQGPQGLILAPREAVRSFDLRLTMPFLKSHYRSGLYKWDMLKDLQIFVRATSHSTPDFNHLDSCKMCFQHSGVGKESLFFFSSLFSLSL